MLLEGWESFYVIVGSSAGALIGLQFVVITLMGERPIPDTRAAAAYTTPTVVHFGVVLLLSAILSAPWHGIAAAAVVWGLVGVCGVVNEIVVSRRLRGVSAYQPVLEDWLFHVVFPLVAYAVLCVSACAVGVAPRMALFLVGGAALGLLFIGIHNAWDLATYHIFVRKKKEDDAAGR